MSTATGLRVRFNLLVIMLLERYGSEHIKRIIFFGSLFPYALQLNSLKRDVMDKLNQHMGLARTGSALLFPATFRNLIWKDVNLEEVLRPEDISDHITPDRALEISTRVVQRTPKCLRWGPKDGSRMIREFCEMLLSGQHLVPN